MISQPDWLPRGTVTDYGHDLLFGGFVTPGSRNAEQTVALAMARERAGLDLVTFQDHPYQPAFPGHLDPAQL